MKKLIVKRFNSTVAQHFFPISIATTSNALPYDVVNSRTVNTFTNCLDADWEDNPPDVQVNWLHRLMFSAYSMDSGGPCMVESKW